MYRKRLAVAYLVIKGHNYLLPLVLKMNEEYGRKKAYDSHGEPMSMKPLVMLPMNVWSPKFTEHSQTTRRGMMPRAYRLINVETSSMCDSQMFE